MPDSCQRELVSKRRCQAKLQNAAGTVFCQTSVTVLTILVGFLWISPPVQAEQRPNIILIMADDIGMECLGCYGSKQYDTPNLNRLAGEGMRFSNAHSQPICTPSRVQLMTGIYNNRNYLRFGLLDPAAYTFGNALRGAGYQTCVAGKWQLGGGFDGPRRFGFDRYCLWQLTRRPSRYPNPGFEIDGNEVDFKQGQFGPDIATNYINRFIDDHSEAPFFVYYPMIAPHWPFVPTPDHPDWDPAMWRDAKGEPNGYKDDKYWDAMVRYTDKMVGKILDHLDRRNLADNTLVIWTGDNGTYESVTSTLNGFSYVGGKGKTTDNGTHVGFLARWPGVIQQGTESETLVDFSDVFPTLLDAAGITQKSDKLLKKLGLSGKSLLPAFKGKQRKKDHIYCWYERNGDRAKASEHVRTDRFKLYSDGRFYDTIEDLYETHDLSSAKLTDDVESIRKMLQNALQTHHQQTLEQDEILATRRKQF